MRFLKLKPKSKKSKIQPKLTFGQSDDVYEQEANAIADQVMQMPTAPNSIQRKCENCEEEVQMKPLSAAITPVIQKQSEEEEMVQMKPMKTGGAVIQRKTFTEDPGSTKSLHDDLTRQFANEMGIPFEPGLQYTEEYRLWLSRSVKKQQLQKQVKILTKELQQLIDGATWKEIRKRVYPLESAAGIKRAKERKEGKLPDLTGLGRIKALESFTKQVKTIQKDWAKLTPTLRLIRLANAINTEMKNADVPGFLAFDKAPMEFKGFFRASQWKFVLNEASILNNSLSDKDAAEIANTLMHEGRHAEQQFLAARFSAGTNRKTIRQIATEQHIPTAIAAKAFSMKFDAGTDKKIVDLGKEMFKATVTDRAKNQKISNDDGLPELAQIREKAKNDLAKLKSSGTALNLAEATKSKDKLSAQIKEVERLYTLYRNIPYEADAHEVGDATEQAFKGWP